MLFLRQLLYSVSGILGSFLGDFLVFLAERRVGTVARWGSEVAVAAAGSNRQQKQQQQQQQQQQAEAATATAVASSGSRQRQE